MADSSGARRVPRALWRRIGLKVSLLLDTPTNWTTAAGVLTKQGAATVAATCGNAAQVQRLITASEAEMDADTAGRRRHWLCWCSLRWPGEHPLVACACDNDRTDVLRVLVTAAEECDERMARAPPTEDAQFYASWRLRMSWLVRAEGAYAFLLDRGDPVVRQALPPAPLTRSRGRYPQRPLQRAARAGSARVLRYLSSLPRKCGLDDCPPYALVLAAAGGHEAAVEVLLDPKLPPWLYAKPSVMNSAKESAAAHPRVVERIEQALWGSDEEEDSDTPPPPASPRPWVALDVGWG